MNHNEFSVIPGQFYEHIDSGVPMRLLSVDAIRDRQLGLVCCSSGNLTWRGSLRNFFSQFKPYKPKKENFHEG